MDLPSPKRVKRSVDWTEEDVLMLLDSVYKNKKSLFADAKSATSPCSSKGVLDLRSL